MEPIVLTNEALAKFGVLGICVSILVWLLITLLKRFFKDDSDKSIILTKEREELKERVHTSEKKIDTLYDLIINRLMSTVEKNDSAYNKMCESNDRMCKAISELSAKINRRRAEDKDKEET